MRVGKLMHEWQTDDAIGLVVFTTGPARVRVWARDDVPGRTWTVGRGVHKLSHSMVPGGGMRAQVIRGDVVVAECAPSVEEFVVQERPQTYNFNVFTAMSP